VALERHLRFRRFSSITTGANFCAATPLKPSPAPRTAKSPSREQRQRLLAPFKRPAKLRENRTRRLPLGAKSRKASSPKSSSTPSNPKPMTLHRLPLAIAPVDAFYLAATVGARYIVPLPLACRTVLRSERFIEQLFSQFFFKIGVRRLRRNLRQRHEARTCRQVACGGCGTCNSFVSIVSEP